MNSGLKQLALPLLFLLWGLFALWQYSGYQSQRELIRESLRAQTHSVLHALIGGAGSHRRRGQFFEEQLQAMLDELVQSGDVLAAAITSADGYQAAEAGTNDLQLEDQREPGAYWTPDGFCLVEKFELGPADRAGGGGPGRRYGRGLGPRSQAIPENGNIAVDVGGTFLAMLLVDRRQADALVQRAAQSHTLVALGGGLVLVLVGLAWNASVKAVAAQGQTELLQEEAKHLRDLSQAAAGLAHETRNPLGIIRGWTQRLAKSEDDPQRAAQAHAVIEECDRLTARINQFLAFAKPPACRPESVGLADLVDELAMLLQPDLDEKQISLKTVLTDRCSTVTADRELLRQALFNLLQNAINFSPAGETVLLSSVPESRGCRIEVSDRGPGVAADDVKSLFTPYFTTRTDGTGLGLAIVRQITNLHGWQVRYSPRDGGGATFSIEHLHG
jgi:signal transduction histidine kinase